MAKAKSSHIVGEIVELLTPVSSEERKRIISASLLLLGDSPIVETPVEDEQPAAASTSGTAKTWQKQNQITAEQLGQVFHNDNGNIHVIMGEMPGKNSREKTINAYVLTGIAQLLTSGEPKFTDKDARKLCSSAGCYDSTNHTKAMQAKGNLFTGTKEKGWTLTAPGLKHAAKLLKGLPSEEK
jgi:hypothetical protein